MQEPALSVNLRSRAERIWAKRGVVYRRACRARPRTATRRGVAVSDQEKGPRWGVSNRSLSFAGSAQRLRVPALIGGSGNAKLGGAELASSCDSSIRSPPTSTP